MIRSNDANVAVTFGLALIPIVMAIGMAVDLAFVETAKSHLQQAVDVAALSALADNTSESKRAAAARFAFDANLPEEIRGLSPSFDVEISGASTSPIAATRFTAQVPLAFGGLFGMTSLEVSGSATAGTSSGAAIDVDL